MALGPKVPQLLTPVAQAICLVTQIFGRPVQTTQALHWLCATISTPWELKTHTWPNACEASATTETLKSLRPGVAHVNEQSMVAPAPTPKLPIFLGVGRQEARPVTLLMMTFCRA